MEADPKDVQRYVEAQGVSVSALRSDSRCIAHGDVFLAYPGERVDGRRYIQDAIQAGAAAVIWERDGFAWRSEWNLPNLAVDNLRQFAGYLADEVYGHPSARLQVIGVTGTNGKTSCSQWIAQALDDAGRCAAVIGTLGIGYPGALTEQTNTTPDALVLHAALKRFADEGAHAVVMEASSIGLAQGRMNGVRVHTALFTNLSRDHMDYHADMEAYAQAKMLLFRQPHLRYAVVNLDDVAGVRIAHALTGMNIERVGYSTAREAGMRSGLEHYLEARSINLSQHSISFELASSWGEAHIELPLLGKFNVANVLGVLGVLLISGLSLIETGDAVQRLRPVAGRMQQLGGDGQPLIVVDYAHTPDALDKVLGALRDLARMRGGRLLCIFGCGGERDRGKRPLMGEAASRYADKVIVTSDNPRSEDPMAIIAEILPGLDIPHEIEIDRRAAIYAGIEQAFGEDIVLIAGKGHESYQEVAGERLPFSDFDEARRALEAIVS